MEITVDIIKMISHLHRKSQMYLNEKLDPLGLTAGLVPFLMISCDHPGVPQHSFCQFLDMDKSTVAKMLAKLEIQDYVTRRPDPEDSRSVRVYPSPKAKDLYSTLDGLGKAWTLELTKDLTELERTVLMEMLRRASQNASDYFTG